MRKFIQQLKEGFLPILDVLIPRSKDEKWIFWIFFFVFACFSVLFFRKYGNEFPDWEIINYDLYYIKDFHKLPPSPFGGGNRHPLFAVILFPLNIVVFITNLLYSDNLPLSHLVIYLFFNVITALSILIVYKYCVNLIRISNLQALCLCILFALFAHVLLLSFIPETFPLSMFGLLLVVYMITDSFLNQKKIPIITNIILFMYVTGITISNGLKCVFAQLVQYGDFKYKRNAILLSGILTFILIIVSFSAHYIVAGDMDWGTKNSVSQYIFAGETDIISEMFFEPILFHHKHSLWGYGEEKFEYNSFFPVIVNLILYAVIICALIVNLRKKVVLLYCSFFGVDLLIHLVCGFGIADVQVYCLHWLFLFPLLIGWLYKAICNEKVKTGLTVLLLLLSILLAVNNIPRILELIY